MGKCPERPSSSPPAVVGTFPYNLLNGTAWARLLLLGKLNSWERGRFDALLNDGER